MSRDLGRKSPNANNDWLLQRVSEKEGSGSKSTIANIVARISEQDILIPF